jgi:dihydrofolate synthase/folylpolyglutamate synthase
VVHCPSLSIAPALATVQTALDALGLESPGRNPEHFEWPLTGRFEVARRRPPLILDGAHCPLAAEQVAATLERIADDPLRLCLAMMCEKDHAGFVRALRLEPGDAVALPALPYPRAAKPRHLEQVLRTETPVSEIRRFRTVASAMRWLQTLRPRGVTLATGSFYHLAPARRSLAERARGG